MKKQYQKIVTTLSCFELSKKWYHSFQKIPSIYTGDESVTNKICFKKLFDNDSKWFEKVSVTTQKVLWFHYFFLFKEQWRPVPTSQHGINILGRFLKVLMFTIPTAQVEISIVCPYQISRYHQNYRLTSNIYKMCLCFFFISLCNSWKKKYISK